MAEPSPPPGLIGLSVEERIEILPHRASLPKYLQRNCMNWIISNLMDS